MHPVQRAATVSLIATCAVVAVKLIGAYYSGSISVFAEGLQSFVDVLIAFGVVQMVKLAARPPDDSHPYGHGKAEVLMSGLQMLLIMSTSGFVIAQAVPRLMEPAPVKADLGMIALGFGLIVNLIVAAWIAPIAQQHQSSALKGEVLHLRSDALSAAGLLVGLIAVHFTNWLALDPLLAIGFTILVVVLAVNQLRGIVHMLMDGAAPSGEIAQIEAVLKTHPMVKGFHNLRTRTVGATHHVDLHILLDDALSFVEAHDLAEDVESQISTALGGARVNVHYEPYAAELRHQEEAHSNPP